MQSKPKSEGRQLNTNGIKILYILLQKQLQKTVMLAEEHFFLSLRMKFNQIQVRTCNI